MSREFLMPRYIFTGEDALSGAADVLKATPHKDIAK